VIVIGVNRIQHHSHDRAFPRFQCPACILRGWRQFLEMCDLLDDTRLHTRVLVSRRTL
jgi:hypothetical protein